MTGSARDSPAFRVIVLCKPVAIGSLADFELPCTPFYGVFFPPFLPKLYSPLPKPQKILTASFLPNIADRLDDASFPTQHFPQISLHSTNFKIFAGVPPENKFRMCSFVHNLREKACNHHDRSDSTTISSQDLQHVGFHACQFTISGS